MQLSNPFRLPIVAIAGSLMVLPATPVREWPRGVDNNGRSPRDGRPPIR
jgi:hypothetical protein